MPNAGFPHITEEMWEEFYDHVKRRNSKISAARHIIQKYSLPHQAKSIVGASSHREAALKVEEELWDYQPNLPPELKVPYEDLLILADCHTPYLHTLNVSYAIACAKQQGIKKCVLLGDTFDNDWISRYLDPIQLDQSALEEVFERHTYGFLYALWHHFDEIYVVRGNHDDRALKAWLRKVTFDRFFRAFCQPDSGAGKPNVYDKFTVTENAQMVIEDSPTGPWELMHQRNYSVIPGNVARKMSKEVECNVMTSHEHHLNLGTSGTRSNHYAVACPMAGDPRKIAYKRTRRSLHPHFVVGWATLINGIPTTHHYHKELGMWGLT